MPHAAPALSGSSCFPKTLSDHVMPPFRWLGKRLQICKFMQEVYAPDSCHILISLDLDLVSSLHLDITAQE